MDSRDALAWILGSPQFASLLLRPWMTKVGRRKRGQVYVTGSRNPLFLLTIRNFTIRFSPRLPPILHNPGQFLPSGTPIMTVIAWGGTGASALRQT